MKKRKLINSYFQSTKPLPTSSDSSSSDSNHLSLPTPSYIECPYCTKTFPSEFINLHLSIHDGDGEQDKSEATTQKRSKDVLAQAQAQASTSTSTPASTQTQLSSSPSPSRSSHALQYLIANQRLLGDMNFYFILEMSDDRILPKIHFASEFNSSLCDQYLWRTEVNLRNFDGYVPPIGSSSTPLQRKCHLTLLTNIPPRDHDLKDFLSNPHVLDRGEISLYKSMIQKAFRRGLMVEGAHISFQLLLHCPEEFLRRLPIILIEDGLLHWSYPIVTWLMIAVSKGYEPPLTLLLICLHVYIEGSLTKYQDIICDVPIPIPISIPNVDDNHEIQPNCSPQILASISDLQQSSQRTLITTLLLRAAYGGMEGDLQMLRHSASQWTTRFFFMSSADSNEGNITDSLPQNQQPHLYLHSQYLSSLGNYFDHSLPDLTPYLTQNVDQQSVNHFNLLEIHQYIEQTLPLLCSPLNPSSTLHHTTQSFLSSTLHFDPTHHLVSEGVDFHCDSQLIPSLVRTINTIPEISMAYQTWFQNIFEKDMKENSPTSKLELDSQQNYLRKTIWLFRSSINLRRRVDWNDGQEEEKNDKGMFKILTKHEITLNKNQQIQILNVKTQFAGLWRIICPLLNEYSMNKLENLRERLLLVP